MRKGKTESILDLSMAITVHCCSLLTISQTFPLIISTPLRFQLQLPVLGRGMTHHFPGFCCSGVRNFSGNLPPGYRFSPTDKELFQHYLIPKRLGHPIYGIPEIDLYSYNPGDILDPTNKKLCDQVWYFFCIRENHNNDSFNRKAGSGFWKSTGRPRSVTAEGSDEEIGTVRILVFRDPKETHWVMHEFELKAKSNSHVKDNYVLCRIRLQPNKKNKGVKRLGKSEPRCKTSNPKKKARKGKSNCNRASASTTASENQNLTDIFPSSNYHKGAAAAAYGKGESSKKAEPSCCTAAACSENQNSCPMNFGNENRNSNEIMSIFSPNNKVETSHPMNLGNEKQKNKMTHDHQSLGPVTFGNESLSQGVDIAINHQRHLLISNSEEVTLQEKQTDECGTLDTSRSYNFQGNGKDKSIWMSPNGGEAMSAQVDPELAEADREAFKQLCEEVLHSELAEADKEAFKQLYEEHSELAEADEEEAFKLAEADEEEAFKQLCEELFTPDEQPISDGENPK